MQFYKAVTGVNPNYFLTYANVKSAARVQPGLRSNGAHRFNNYDEAPKEAWAAEAAACTYTTFDDILAGKNRCDCDEYEDNLKNCFILDFDRVLWYVKLDEVNEDVLPSFVPDAEDATHRVVHGVDGNRVKFEASSPWSSQTKTQGTSRTLSDSAAHFVASEWSM